MFSQKDTILLKISKIQTLSREVVKFDDNMFKSNCLSAQDIKEDLLSSFQDYKDDLENLVKNGKDLSDFEKIIDNDTLEIEKALEGLKTGKPYICAIFI